MKRIIKQMIILVLVIIATIVTTIYISKEFATESFKAFTVSFTQERNEKELKDIIGETLKDRKFAVEKVNTFNRDIRVKASDISEKEKEEIIQKFNTKYGEKLEKINLVEVPKKDIFAESRTYVIYAVVIIVVTVLANVGINVSEKIRKEN